VRIRVSRITYRDLYERYLSWPERILDSMRRSQESCDPVESMARGLLIAGIGGSGAPGRIYEAFSILRGSKPGVWSISGTDLDPRLDYIGISAICVSYSGTTVETIRVLEKILSMGLRTGVVTSGGSMLDIAMRRSLPLYRLDKGSLPRLELPQMMVGILAVSKCLGASLDAERDLIEASELLRRERKNIEAIARDIAEKILGAFLSGKRISIAATKPYYPVIHRIRSELSENAAVPSEPIEIPEMGHNAVASLRSGKGSLVIYIEDQDRGEDLAFKGYLKRLADRYPEIEVLGLATPPGVGYLAKVLYISMIIGLGSTELGQRLGGIPDPSSINEIRLFREHMYSYYSLS